MPTDSDALPQLDHLDGDVICLLEDRLPSPSLGRKSFAAGGSDLPLLTAVLTLQRAATGRTEALELPATRVAVMVHDGPLTDLDQTYGALGTIVAEQGLSAGGPIREHYLADDHTEVCWPITQGATE